MKIFFFFIVVLINIINNKETENQYICPQQELEQNFYNLGQGYNIIDYTPKQQLFQFSCKYNKYNIDGTKKIPDYINQNNLMYIDYNNIINQENMNYINIDHIKKDILTPQLQFFEENLQNKEANHILGDKNQQIQEIKNKIIQNQKETPQKIYQQIYLSYKKYNVEIENNSYNLLNLNKEFQNDINQLPQNYEYNTYSQFLDKYGTHFSSKITVGGQLQLSGFLEKSIIEQNNSNEDFQEYFQYLLEKQYNLSKNQVFTDKNPQNQQKLDELIEKYNNLTQLKIIGGGDQIESLNHWISVKLDQNPAIINQNLIEISNLINDTTIRQNTEKAIKRYLKITVGCPDKNAINYTENAVLFDEKVCYYTVFDSSYQTATKINDYCDYKKFQLKNKETQDFSCDITSTSYKIAEYNIQGCHIKQYFCIKNENFNENQEDLTQSLQICNNQVVSNNFYKNNNQYYCQNVQQDYYVDFKKNNQIYFCKQNFCLNKEKQQKKSGIKQFIEQYQGQCNQKYQKQDINPFEICGNNCLIQYGKIQIQEKCIINQYICLYNKNLESQNLFKNQTKNLKNQCLKNPQNSTIPIPLPFPLPPKNTTNSNNIPHTQPTPQPTKPQTVPKPQPIPDKNKDYQKNEDKSEFWVYFLGILVFLIILAIIVAYIRDKRMKNNTLNLSVVKNSKIIENSQHQQFQQQRGNLFISQNLNKNVNTSFNYKENFQNYKNNNDINLEQQNFVQFNDENNINNDININNQDNQQNKTYIQQQNFIQQQENITKNTQQDLTLTQENETEFQQQNQQIQQQNNIQQPKIIVHPQQQLQQQVFMQPQVLVISKSIGQLQSSVQRNVQSNLVLQSPIKQQIRTIPNNFN